MTYIVLIIVVALAFDYINGFHDAANSIATVVGTRVLSPRVAVIWAAFFNFVAAFALETRVAKTIGKGIVDPKVVDPDLINALKYPNFSARPIPRIATTISPSAGRCVKFRSIDESIQ